LSGATFVPFLPAEILLQRPKADQPALVVPRREEPLRLVNTWKDRARNLSQEWIVNMKANVRPLGKRVIVEAVVENGKTAKKGGIIIPDSAKEKPMESIVVALGTGETDDNGKKVPFEVKKGDRVLVTRYGGTEIKLDGKEYKILSTDDILAIIE
jgi:chaperonin GroES